MTDSQGARSLSPFAVEALQILECEASHDIESVKNIIISVLCVGHLSTMNHGFARGVSSAGKIGAGRRQQSLQETLPTQWPAFQSPSARSPASRQVIFASLCWTGTDLAWLGCYTRKDAL